jgi:hypothetical protein
MKKRILILLSVCGTLLSSCVYHKIEENPDPENAMITFTKDIRPLMISRCGACHKEDGEIDFAIYTNTVSNIDLILHRVQRDQAALGFMPQDGAPLSSDEIQLLKQWRTEGTLK